MLFIPLFLLTALAAAIPLDPQADILPREDIYDGQSKPFECPKEMPDVCDCEKFNGETMKFIQCVTNPFCERCANEWAASMDP